MSSTDARGTPVILDTDIGTDIDDTWALALILNSPELDLRLLVTDTGDTTERARIAARLLEVAGRSDVPIGIGIPLEDAPTRHVAWVEGYGLDNYSGDVHQDGVGALIDVIMDAPADEPVTLICIGPLPNIAAALQREPRIAQRARFVGMHGSIRLGYRGSPDPAPEYNVASYPRACQRVFTAPWEVTITPLDTCGLVTLAGERYQQVRDCADPLVEALISNYRIWAKDRGGYDPEQQSSTLFDTVAVYLAFSQKLVEMEDLDVRVTDDGLTVVEDGAKTLHCATAWRNLPAFQDFLVERLTAA